MSTNLSHLIGNFSDRASIEDQKSKEQSIAEKVIVIALKNDLNKLFRLRILNRGCCRVIDTYLAEIKRLTLNDYRLSTLAKGISQSPSNSRRWSCLTFLTLSDCHFDSDANLSLPKAVKVLTLESCSGDGNYCISSKSLKVLILRKCDLPFIWRQNFPLSKLKELQLSNHKPQLTADAFNYLPKTLCALSISGSEIISGALANLPKKLENFSVENCATIKDSDIENLPREIKNLTIRDCADISVNIKYLKWRFHALEYIKNSNLDSSIPNEKNSRMATVRKELEKSVLRQPAAVGSACRLIEILESGLKNDGRPEVLFFAGPTGTGKKTFAKAIADILQPRRELITLDMAQFDSFHGFTKFVGVGPGLKGRQGLHPKLEKVRNKPYVVLILDNFDQADEEVLKLLPGLLNNGILNDGDGNAVDFSKAIIIFTTNISDKEYLSFFNSNNNQESMKKATKYIEKRIKDEYPNLSPYLVPALVPFRKLSWEGIIDIAMREATKILEKYTSNIEGTITINKTTLRKFLDTENLSLGTKPVIHKLQQQITRLVSNHIRESWINQGNSEVIVSSSGNFRIVRASLSPKDIDKLKAMLDKLKLPAVNKRDNKFLTVSSFCGRWSVVKGLPIQMRMVHAKAVQGDPEAQFQLAKFYLERNDDSVGAETCLKMAATNGHEGAAELIRLFPYGFFRESTCLKDLDFPRGWLQGLNLGDWNLTDSDVPELTKILSDENSLHNITFDVSSLSEQGIRTLCKCLPPSVRSITVLGYRPDSPVGSRAFNALHDSVEFLSVQSSSSILDPMRNVTENQFKALLYFLPKNLKRLHLKGFYVLGGGARVFFQARLCDKLSCLEDLTLESCYLQTVGCALNSNDLGYSIIGSYLPPKLKFLRFCDQVELGGSELTELVKNLGDHPALELIEIAGNSELIDKELEGLKDVILSSRLTIDARKCYFARLQSWSTPHIEFKGNILTKSGDLNGKGRAQKAETKSRSSRPVSGSNTLIKMQSSKKSNMGISNNSAVVIIGQNKVVRRAACLKDFNFDLGRVVTLNLGDWEINDSEIPELMKKLSNMSSLRNITFNVSALGVKGIHSLFDKLSLSVRSIQILGKSIDRFGSSKDSNSQPWDQNKFLSLLTSLPKNLRELHLKAFDVSGGGSVYSLIGPALPKKLKTLCFYDQKELNGKTLTQLVRNLDPHASLKEIKIGCGSLLYDKDLEDLKIVRLGSLLTINATKMMFPPQSWRTKHIVLKGGSSKAGTIPGSSASRLSRSTGRKAKNKSNAGNSRGSSKAGTVEGKGKKTGKKSGSSTSKLTRHIGITRKGPVCWAISLFQALRNTSVFRSIVSSKGPSNELLKALIHLDTQYKKATKDGCPLKAESIHDFIDVADKCRKEINNSKGLYWGKRGSYNAYDPIEFFDLLNHKTFCLGFPKIPVTNNMMIRLQGLSQILPYLNYNQSGEKETLRLQFHSVIQAQKKCFETCDAADLNAKFHRFLNTLQRMGKAHIDSWDRENISTVVDYITTWLGIDDDQYRRLTNRGGLPGGWKGFYNKIKKVESHISSKDGSLWKALLHWTETSGSGERETDLLLDFGKKAAHERLKEYSDSNYTITTTKFVLVLACQILELGNDAEIEAKALAFADRERLRVFRDLDITRVKKPIPTLQDIINCHPIGLDIKKGQPPSLLTLRIQKAPGKSLQSFVKSIKVGNTTYHTNAIVAHIENPGHYVAYKRIGTDTWLFSNDDKTFPKKGKEVEKETAGVTILLFLEKKT